MNIGELFVQLVFQSDQTKLKDFVNSLGDLNMSSVMATLSFGTMYESIKKIMGIADQTAIGVDSFTKSTGLSGKQMQQFSAYAEQMGASADDAKSALGALQMNAFKVRMGEGNIRSFTLTGISPYQDTFKIVEDIRKKLLDPGISDAMKRLVTQEFGLSEAMMMVLKSSDAQWESMRRNVFMTEEQVRSMKDYHKEAMETGQDWKALMGDIGASLSPAIQGLMTFSQGILEGIKNSKDLQVVLLGLGVIVALFIGGWVALGVIITGIVLSSLGYVIYNLKAIGDWVNKVLTPLNTLSDKISGFMSNLGAKIDQGNIGFNSLTPAMSGVVSGGTSKVQTNNYSFKVLSNDPQEAARKIYDIMKQIHGDAEYSSPSETK